VDSHTEELIMSASIFGERVLALLGALLICAFLWAPIASPVQVAATVQAVDHAVGARLYVR
jgi:hypothetical protein